MHRISPLTRPIVTLLALTALVALGGIPASAATWKVNCDPATGPDSLTINGGIALAADGDTIVVQTCLIFPFTYNESVVIATRTGLHLVAADGGFFGTATEGVGAPLFGAWPVVIDASGLGSCVEITSSEDILVSGFAMTNAGADGVFIESSNRVTIENNRIDRPSFSGVIDIDSHNNRIVGNVVTRTGIEGISLSKCTRCLVNDNRVLRLGLAGISLDGADGSVVTNNEVQQATTDGIHVVSGIAQRVVRNTSVGNVGVDILIDTLAVDTDVIGNDVAAAPLDLGTGTDAAVNF